MDPDKLSVASVRPARTEEDIDRAQEFLRTPRVREIIEAHPEERGCVRLCEAEGELIAALLIDPAPLRIRDVDMRCARLHETGGEDGRRLFRDTGDPELFEYMMEEFLGYLWARRYPIAYVHGELALYPQHGFVPCFYHPRVYVDVAAAIKLPAEYRVRHLKADDVRSFPELRQKHRRWKPVVFATGVPRFHHFTIESTERKIRGCFSLETNPDARWNPRVFAPEVDVADRKAACTLLRHCAEKASELDIKQIHFSLGPGHPVARLCLEIGGQAVMRGAATDPRLNEEMIHIADPVRFGTALAPYFKRRLKRRGLDLSVSIPIHTDHGHWSLNVREGEATIDGHDGPGEGGLEIPHWALTQLLVGYKSVDELDADIDEEQRSVLRLLFPKTWPFSMPDPDHWATRIPPYPYSKEALTFIEHLRLPWADVQHG